MIRKIQTSILAAALLSLAAAGTASAAADRTLTITPDKTAVTWDGKTSTSFSGTLWETLPNEDPAASCHQYGADPIDDCDETLVKLDGTDPGSLDFQLPETGDGNTTDWDLFVYAADADGNAGDLLGSSEEAGDPEDVVVDDSTTSDNYLVVAVPFQSVQGTYTGAVTLAPPSDDTSDEG